MSEMNPTYLWKDELVWELRVRGIQADPSSKVIILKSLLRKLLKAEKDDSIIPHPAVPMDFQQAITICQRKLTVFHELVNIFNSDKRNIEYKRIMSRLLHVKHRLNYIVPNNQQENELRSELITQNDFLISSLKLKAQVNDINLLNPNDTDGDSAESSSEDDSENSVAIGSRRVSFAADEQLVNVGEQPRIIIHSDVRVRGPAQEALQPNSIPQNLNNNEQNLNENNFESSNQPTRSRTPQHITSSSRNTQENTNSNTTRRTKI